MHHKVHNNNGDGISIPSHLNNSRQHPAPSATFACIRDWKFSFLLIIFFLLFLGVLFLNILAVFFATPIIFRVVNVSLIQFDLNNNTLHYNLTVNMNVRNPNRVIGVFYDEIEVNVFYLENRIDSVNLMPFKQGLGNTTTLHTVVLQGETVLVPTPTLCPVVFQGRVVLVPTPLEIMNSKLHGDYNRDKSAGSFDIQVHLHTKIRYLVGRIKHFFGIRPNFKCDLKRVPLISSNGGSGGWNGRTAKKCKEYYY